MLTTLTDGPLRDALDAYGRAFGGLRDVIASIEAMTPAPDASEAEQLKFSAALANVLDEGQRSLAMATGELAFHLRRMALADVLAANATFKN